MKKTSVLAAIALIVFSACDNKNIDGPAMAPGKVVIEPVITRALSLNFRDGDKIGLDVIKADNAVHATNACLEYASGSFQGELSWYAQGGEACSLKAYYPYCQGGFPETFTVNSDQSAGTESSDLMVAGASDVYPTANPVLMKFKHLLSQISIDVVNTAGAELSGITIRNIIPTAVISAGENGSWVATVDPDAAPADIKAEPITAGSKYCVVVVPQSFEKLGVAVDVKNGNTLLADIEEAELKPGYSYTLTLTVLADQVKVGISGEIEDWQEGGSLDGGDPEDGGKPVDPVDPVDPVNPVDPDVPEGYISYGGRLYKTVELSNGDVWMAEPLAYIPEGKTVGAAADNTGIFYPYTVVDGAAVALTDEESIKEYGYLYSANIYLGETLTPDNYRNFEGARGICPDGWHIPSRMEWVDILGHADSDDDHDAADDPGAVFFDTGVKYAHIGMMNAGGWNFVQSGMANKGKYLVNLTTEAKCSVEELLGKHGMSLYACSSGAIGTGSSGRTYSMFTVQTTFTSAYPLGRVAVAKTAFENGAQVRCIKDK